MKMDMSYQLPNLPAFGFPIPLSKVFQLTLELIPLPTVKTSVLIFILSGKDFHKVDFMFQNRQHHRRVMKRDGFLQTYLITPCPIPRTARRLFMFGPKIMLEIFLLILQRFKSSTTIKLPRFQLLI